MILVMNEERHVECTKLRENDTKEYFMHVLYYVNLWKTVMLLIFCLHITQSIFIKNKTKVFEFKIHFWSHTSLSVLKK